MKEDSKRIKDTPESPASVSLPDSSQGDTPGFLIAKWAQVLATYPAKPGMSARERRARRVISREVARLQSLKNPGATDTRTRLILESALADEFL